MESYPHPPRKAGRIKYRQVWGPASQLLVQADTCTSSLLSRGTESSRPVTMLFRSITAQDTRHLASQEPGKTHQEMLSKSSHKDRVRAGQRDRNSLLRKGRQKGRI